MSRVLPQPPQGVLLSEVPALTDAQACQWFAVALGLDGITPRWLKTVTESGELQCRIVARRRRYSTAELFRFIVSRPNHTAGKKATA